MTRMMTANAIAPPAPRLQARAVASGVVAPVDFTLQAGQCLVVAGPSGAGKTRLLRLLADLDEGSGEVWLDGLARDAMAAPQWRAQVLYQGAESAWWHPNVIGHFPAEQHAAALRLAARLGLGADRLAADLAELSSGERQRAALVRSVLQQPKVLLLDEPSSALDADNVGRMETLLMEQLQAGMALILVTHSQAQAQRLGQATLMVQRRSAS